jgi:hypothetical protein
MHQGHGHFAILHATNGKPHPAITHFICAPCYDQIQHIGMPKVVPSHSTLVFSINEFGHWHVIDSGAARGTTESIFPWLYGHWVPDLGDWRRVGDVIQVYKSPASAERACAEYPVSVFMPTEPAKIFPPPVALSR